jgi:tetratricopeptide (TPR) repeat protein
MTSEFLRECTSYVEEELAKYGRELDSVPSSHGRDREGSSSRAELLAKERLYLTVGTGAASSAHSQVLKYYQKVLEQDRKRGDRSECVHLDELGVAYLRHGQCEEAVEYLEQALTVSKELGDRQGIGRASGDLGRAYCGLAQYQHALELLEQSLSISRELGDRLEEAMALCSCGKAYFRLGQYDRAREHHAQALTISREIGDRQVEGIALSNLGETDITCGQYELAIDHFEQAKLIRAEQPVCAYQLESLTEGRIGSAKYSLGQYEQALSHLARALSFNSTKDQQFEAGIKSMIGLTLFDLLREGKPFPERFGPLPEGGPYKRAIQWQYEAIVLAIGNGDRQGEGTYSCRLGSCFIRLEEPDYDRALGFLGRACELFDNIWSEISSDGDRVTFGDTESPTTANKELQRALIATGRHDNALEQAERAHARSLEVVLAELRITARQSTALFGQGQAAAMTPADLDLASLQSLAARQRAALVVFSHINATTLFAWVVGSGGGASKPAFREISIAKHDKSLGQLVELMRRKLNVGARHAATWSAGPRRSCAARDLGLLTDDEDIDEAALTTAISSTDASSLLRRCYELLIAPFADVIVAESSLIIVPDRDLFALPFAALLDGDGKHLVEKHVVRVVPSAGTLIELEQRLSSRPKSDAKVTALVVGNPDFHGWAVQLPGAEAEAKEVCKRLQEQGQTTYLSRGEATKANVVEALSACTYVHLATHGVADGVYLSGRTKADGKLTMAEVQELDLPCARLVVLSECNSFKGELKADGVIGITRAFAAAGAPTLVASLWEVSDVATRKLMTRFYDALLGPEAAGDAAVALQVAMVSMLREGWTVSEWAAFVVHGLAATEVT